MNVGKKFGRVKQWAGEKMGQESKTEVSDEFKSLEMEMQLRHEGMSAKSSHGSCSNICQEWKSCKSLWRFMLNPFPSETKETTEKRSYQWHSWARQWNIMEKILNRILTLETVLLVGKLREYTRIQLIGITAMGTANDRISRQQDAYVHEATSTWLESLERSLAQMKEYQVCKRCNSINGR